MTDKEAADFLKKSTLWISVPRKNTKTVTQMLYLEAMAKAISALEEKAKAIGPNQWMEKEPRRGTWTEEFDESANPFFQRRWRCSACNDYNYYGRPKFCPCCGADMREGDENE